MGTKIACAQGETDKTREHEQQGKKKGGTHSLVFLHDYRAAIVDPKMLKWIEAVEYDNAVFTDIIDLVTQASQHFCLSDSEKTVRVRDRMSSQ